MYNYTCTFKLCGATVIALHCTDEAQKAETVLNAIAGIHVYTLITFMFMYNYMEIHVHSMYMYIHVHVLYIHVHVRVQ